MRMVVPDQRSVPAIGGRMVRNGAVTGSGIRPSVTMGSEKMTRISFASLRLAISSVGPALTTVKAACGCAPALADDIATHEATNTPERKRCFVMEGLLVTMTATN